MLRRRDRPLKTLEEILQLNNISLKKSKDGRGHLYVLTENKKVEVHEAFNLFDGSYLFVEQRYSTQANIDYEVKQKCDLAKNECESNVCSSTTPSIPYATNNNHTPNKGRTYSQPMMGWAA